MSDKEALKIVARQKLILTDLEKIRFNLKCVKDDLDSDPSAHYFDSELIRNALNAIEEPLHILRIRFFDVPLVTLPAPPDDRKTKPVVSEKVEPKFFRLPESASGSYDVRGHLEAALELLKQNLPPEPKAIEHSFEGTNGTEA